MAIRQLSRSVSYRTRITWLQALKLVAPRTEAAEPEPEPEE